MEYNVLDRKDALSNAWEISNTVYTKTNKIPMSRQRFIAHVDLAYMMGASNTIKDIYNYIKNNPTEDFEVMMGDLQLMVLKAWNNMLENPLGEATLNKMELEDILNNECSSKLFKSKAKIK